MIISKIVLLVFLVFKNNICCYGCSALLWLFEKVEHKCQNSLNLWNSWFFNGWLDVGELEGGDLHHAGDVEVEALGALAGDWLHLDIVDAPFEGFMVGGHEAQEVDDVVFVLGSDDDPGFLLGAPAARHDGGDKAVQAVLADSGAGMFFLLLEDVDVEIHLVQVEHVVVERFLGIFLDAVTLCPGVGLLVVELLDDVTIDALAEGVVVFLEGVAIIEVPPCLDAQGGVVAVVGLHELGVIVGVVGTGDDLADMIKVHLLDGKFALRVTLGHFLAVLRPTRGNRSECHDERDEDIVESMFHSVVVFHSITTPITAMHTIEPATMTGRHLAAK